MYTINLALKRCIDIVCSIMALIILSPVFVVVSIAIKLDSPGPVFFVQKRRTKNGRVFSMYKFRTMILNAEKMGSGLFNFEDDPRITKVGKWLRNSSVDELPQLLNVFKGDLSIVGPRPPVVYELGEFETLNRKYKKRFEFRGGITGLAQVKGRNENNWDEKVFYDNQYVDKFKKQGVWIDIIIILETIVKVLKKQDIYEQKIDQSLSDAEAAKLAEEEVIRIAHMPDEEEIIV